MNQSALFSNGSELAAFVTSLGLLGRSWNAISSIYEGINSNEELSWIVHEESDFTIIAFVTTPFDTQYHLQPDLVSSSDLRDNNNFIHFEFLRTKSNPLFSIDKAAVFLFQENYQKLHQLKSIINSSTPLIITGHALGGSVASLFTLSLLDSTHSVDSGKKRPLCITFGSPLIGDKKLQEAISCSSTYNSCFLHVVSYKDPLPRFFITEHSSSAAQLTPQTSAYMPFGTFLFCSDVGSTCSENPDSTLELLVAIGSIHDQNQGFQSADYGSIVEDLYRKAICKDSTAGAKKITHSDSLHASISLQLYALGFAPQMQQQQQQLNTDINTLVTKMGVMEKEFISQKRQIFDPSKELNEMKIQLECYNRVCKNQGIGYYDSYKNMLLEIDKDTDRLQNNLTLYWKRMVEEAEMKPQKEGAAFRTRCLYAGTNYRRMVEPLDIAQYYKNGDKDYETNRSKHYRQLEEWLTKEGTTVTTRSLNSTSGKNVESILTLDSCFWANVEEALISSEQLKAVESSVTEKKKACMKLLAFEDYVYGLLKNYAVSPEIFLEQSSYMRWWIEYKAIKGTSHNSRLAGFMRIPRNYEQYAMGAFDFQRSLINHLMKDCGLGFGGVK